MQGVQRTDTKARAIASSQIDALLPGAFRKIDKRPNSIGAVLLNVAPYQLRLRKRKPLQKYLSIDCVGKFGTVERRKPNRWPVCKRMVNLGGMDIHDIAGDEKARVRINAQ